jgi:hypothetical protein
MPQNIFELIQFLVSLLNCKRNVEKIAFCPFFSLIPLKKIRIKDFHISFLYFCSNLINTSAWTKIANPSQNLISHDEN